MNRHTNTDTVIDIEIDPHHITCIHMYIHVYVCIYIYKDRDIDPHAYTALDLWSTIGTAAESCPLLELPQQVNRQAPKTSTPPHQ